MPIFEVPSVVLDDLRSDYEGIISGAKSRYMSAENLLYRGRLYMTLGELGGGEYCFVVRSHGRGLDKDGVIRIGGRALGYGDDGGVRRFMYRFKARAMATHLEARYRSTPDTYAILFFLGNPAVLGGELAYRVRGVTEVVGSGHHDILDALLEGYRPEDGDIGDGSGIFLDMDKNVVI